MAEPTEKVLGIGGVFVRAKDQAQLAQWYRDHLGINVDPGWHGGVFPLQSPLDREGAYVVWSAFPQNTEYFGSNSQASMINFRVRDLDAMLTQLREHGCPVDEKVERSEFGAFGWVTDPEGNRVELWQPPDTPPPS